MAELREIESDARAGKLAPVYVIASDHPVLVDRAVTAIRDAAVEPAWRGFNYDVIEGKPTAARITSAANTLPMMAPRRMVLVRDLAPMVAEEQALFAPYLDSPSPTTVLVALTSKLDKRLKLYAAAGKKGFLHVLEAPRHAAPWIRDEAKARGVKMGGDAVERLAEAVGNDLSRLALVIDQLGVYVGAGGAGGRAVTADDVEDLVADTRERSVFELTDAIGAGDLAGALAAVGSLCDQRQSALGVIAMLARFVRQVGQLHAARAAGLGKGELASAVGVPPFVVDKLAQQSRRLPPAAVARAQRVLHDADRALKGQPIDRDVAPDRTEGLTGPSVKALGRQLGERVILERIVTELVSLGSVGLVGLGGNSGPAARVG